jgi:outer membrane receptor for ferric coprogen and ferric-rhodotorulic acid
MTPRYRPVALVAIVAWQLTLAAPFGRAQSAPASGSASESSTTPAAKEADQTVVLSPFTVTTDKDKGYKATNATSGTRLNTPIKELPMPLSVITDQFLKDTGATDLRRGLAYTAGIQLQSQNDQGTPGGAYQGPGGVNNPEGATANQTGTSYKIRGYVTDNVLRDGFRRQHATDSINIGRIEVAFGPTALLYGIGSMGGIVNYIPKAPQAKQSTEVGLSVGSYNLIRTTVDTTGPISQKWSLNYRLTGAWQQNDDYTDFRSHNHYFISPAFTFRPTKTTQVDIDFELGEQKDKGVGFQRVRAMTGVSGGDQGENADFYTLPGTNRRTFRWSGPDTFLNNEATNFRAQVAQKVGDHLDLLVGYNRADAEWTKLDVLGNLFQNQGPAALQKTINVGSPSLNPSAGSSNLNVVSGTINNVILGYGWLDGYSRILRDQVRAEGTFKYDLFQDSNKWLKMSTSLLVGHSEEKQTTEYTNRGTPSNQYNYKSPLDASPIRFGKQGDGTTDLAMIKKDDGYTNAWNQATYGVFSAKMADDRVFVVAGLREDNSDTFVNYRNREFNYGSDTRSPKQRNRTKQYGVSVAIDPARHFSAFALRSEGIMPNYSGARDVNGTPIKAVSALSKEFGLKFDLMDGRISGSVSAFKIQRSGTPFMYWWAPTSTNITFNPNRDIIYNVNNFSPSTVPGGSNGGNGATEFAISQWNAGVAAGAIYQKSVGGSTNWYVNASKPTGAAYLDAVFDRTKALGMSWPGWLYITDAETNNSWDDIAASKGLYVVGSDQTKGWSAEVIFTPNDNFQLIANYAHTEKIITSAGNFAKYPYPQNRWAVWYFPNTDWGLTGKPLSTVYTNPQDTSSWTGIGYGYGEKQDDTPEHAINVWGHYKFTDGALKGFSAGLGGNWESPREYQSGITRGGGQRVTDSTGKPVVLKTDSRLSVNLLAKYEFDWSGRPSAVQLNVDNLLDDQKRYGLIFAAPRTWRLEFTTKL